MDEVSEPSDFEDDDEKEEFDDLSSMSESDEYKPGAAVGEGDDDLVDSEDDDISEDEEDEDGNETIDTKENTAETDEEDLFSIDPIGEENVSELITSEDAICIRETETLLTQDATDLSTEAMTMFTVKVCPDGTVEVLNQEEASKPLGPGYETAIALVGPSKPDPTKTGLKDVEANHATVKPSLKLGQKRKLADDHGNVIGFARVVQIMEEPESKSHDNLPKKSVYSAEKIINPRSLLKAKTDALAEENKTQEVTAASSSQPEPKAHQYTTSISSQPGNPDQDSKNAPLVLFCSLCNYQCGGDGKSGGGQKAMRHHAACKHPRSRFFVLPVGNPHRDCAQCNILMRSYEKTIASDPSIGLKGMLISLY